MFDDRLIPFIERHGDGIETHRRDAFVLQELPPPQRFTRNSQPTSLARRDAVERSLVRARTSSAHFDDDDDVTVLDEQIDLGATDAQVSSEDGIS